MFTLAFGGYSIDVSGRLIVGITKHLDWKRPSFSVFKNVYGRGISFVFGIPFLMYVEFEVSYDNGFN